MHIHIFKAEVWLHREDKHLYLIKFTLGLTNSAKIVWAELYDSFKPACVRLDPSPTGLKSEHMKNYSLSL